MANVDDLPNAEEIFGQEPSINRTMNPSVNPCYQYNCGEAGCTVLQDNRPLCLCAKTLTPPDEFLRCDHNISNPVDPRETVMGPGAVPHFPGPIEPKQPSNTTLQARDKAQNASQEPAATSGVDIAWITVPVVCVTVLFILIIVIVYLVRRRRHAYLRSPKLDASVVFLHKHDTDSLLENLTVVSKNPTYCTHELDDALLAELREKHVHKDKLRLMDEIGEGAFGKVFRGEMQISEQSYSSVAVKILKSDASRETRDDFRREVKIMSSFDHENILKLIGIVPTGEESPYMIFEYMEHGDLTELLRRNDPCLGSKCHIRLRQTNLIDIAAQVSNGMVYLASHHFIHRDLATRNCLVGSELVVKISDFGMSRDIYTCDYYKIGGARMLPVRWMSPESMKYGKFTTESDVWAYGVVLWEIFSHGKQPYYGHGNEEVIRFIEDGILLQKPSGCPETLYHIMLGCWRRDPRERFKFERIHNLINDYEQKVIKYSRQMSSQRVVPPEPDANV